MSDSSLPAARSVSSSCLSLLPVLSLATLILGVAQSAQANDGSLNFNPPPAPTLPAESAAPGTENSVQVASADAPGASQLSQLSNTTPQPRASQARVEVTISRGELFVGGSRSLVAKAVGAAEGTRTPDGHKTPAYYGHVDPGNRAWNLGSFSYQHGASSPEEADRKQLARLETQARILRQQAEARGVELTLEEELNGIDLANQAPLAALDRGGYIDRLIQARQLGMQGSEAVAWARAQSFIDPRTGRLNAPGLGNRLDWVLQDQERRRAAVERAIALHKPTAVNPGAEALIQADTGSNLAEATPIDPVAPGTTTAPTEDLTFNPEQVAARLPTAPPTQTTEPATVARGGPAIAVTPPPQPPSAPPEIAADSPVSRTIASWTEQARLLEQAPDTVVNRLSAQAARVRSGLRSLDRMRSMLPVPAPPAALMESPRAPAPSPAALEPSPTPVQTPLPQPALPPAQSPQSDPTLPTPTPQAVQEQIPPAVPALEPVPAVPQPLTSPESDSSQLAAPPLPPAPQTAEPDVQPTPPAPQPEAPPTTQATGTTQSREEVAEALIRLDLPDFSLATSPAVGP